MVVGRVRDRHHPPPVMLLVMGFEVEKNLEGNQRQRKQARQPGETNEKGAGDDCGVEDERPRVRCEHLNRRFGRRVFMFTDEVHDEGIQVAREEQGRQPSPSRQ